MSGKTNRVRRFVKDWTLPLAICLGVALYLPFRLVPALRPVASWYLPYNSLTLPLCAFAVLYVTFCKVEFRKLRLKRWHLWLGIGQVALVAMVMALIVCLQPVGHRLVFLEATLVCVISPGAMAAAVVTAKLGGSLEEMTAYTLLSNLLATLLIPLCFLCLPSQGEGLSFLRLFLAILSKVSAVLLLPLALALLTKAFLRPLHRLITSTRDLSYNLWAISLIVITGTTVMNILDAWTSTTLLLLLTVALMAMLVCAGQFALGKLLGRRCGRE
ncbi:MAG: transporter, partial [Prevotellaceae bacterium]|nr:transporter [Prevotellaceae bacterium]